jgi:cell division protein FtsB
MPKKVSLKSVIIIGALLAVFLPPFVKYQLLHWKSIQLDSRVKALREEIKRLKAEKTRLETNISYVERKAREKIGIAKKGEIILKDPSVRK